MIGTSLVLWRRASPRAKTALVVLAVSCGVLVALDAAARPGGGHTYSGGGGRSRGGGGGGGSGGGGGEAIFFLVRVLFELCIYYPAIGVPLVITAIVGFAVVSMRNKTSHDWDGPSHGAVMASQYGVQARAPDFGAVRAADPQFSPVLFEDFVYALFAAAHRARADAKKLAELAPYLAENVRRTLSGRAPVGAPVSAVVVGVLRVTGVHADSAGTRVNLEFESNLIFSSGRGRYEREQWTLGRNAGVQSRPSAGARTFPCPNCGAPFESTDSQRCKYCHEVVSNGRFDWSVLSATLVESNEGPPSLTGTVAEQGTDLPSIVDPGFRASFNQLRMDDPAVTEEALASRLALIHAELNRSWNTQDLAPARAFVSDGMFDYLGYWIQAYRSQGLRNVVDDARMVRSELVKLGRDVHYDALTARIFAVGKDYTLDSRGAVVGGDRSGLRYYSEYWTLIRGAGTRGPPRAERNCPNCGAELRIEMSGDCSYCKVRVTTGRFDWVLSKIEQDDSYAG
jgi:predicted lipid-binding transport protein (Tim44 family)